APRRAFGTTTTEGHSRGVLRTPSPLRCAPRRASPASLRERLRLREVAERTRFSLCVVRSTTFAEGDSGEARRETGGSWSGRDSTPRDGGSVPRSGTCGYLGLGTLARRARSRSPCLRPRSACETSFSGHESSCLGHESSFRGRETSSSGHESSFRDDKR